MAELAVAQPRYAVEIATKTVGMGDLETKKRKRGPIDTRQYQRLQNRVKKFKVDAQEWKKKHKNLQTRYDSVKAKYERLQTMFGVKRYKRLEERLATIDKIAETYGKEIRKTRITIEKYAGKV